MESKELRGGLEGKEKKKRERLKKKKEREEGKDRERTSVNVVNTVSGEDEKRGI